MLLIDFPLDIILHILDLLTFEDLVALSQADKGHYSIIQEHGYKLYYIKQKWKILTKSILSSDWRTKVKYGLRTLSNWENKRFSTDVIARQRQSYIPSLRFDTERLVCTVGGDLDIRYFDSNDRTKFDHCRFFPAHAGDIVDIHLSSNGELFTSSTDTTIKRWFLDGQETSSIPKSMTYEGHDHCVQSIYQFNHHPRTLYSAGVDGNMYVWDTETSEVLTSLRLPGRPRVMRGISNDIIAIGNRSEEHLSLYKVTPSGLVHLDNKELNHKSTVYALASNEHLAHTFVTGTFDGSTALFDTRSMERVASYSDRIDACSVYSVDYDNYHIVSGTAMHGMICLWDIRHANNFTNSPNPGSLKRKRVADGWTVYLGRNQSSSPIYSLQLDHSKIYVALANQTWIMNFGGKTSESKRIERIKHITGRVNRRSWRNRGVMAGTNATKMKESTLFYLHDNWSELYEL